MLELELFQVDDNRQLFISPAIDQWQTVAASGVDTVIDLEGGLDACIPTLPDQCLYVYFPIFDDVLPNLPKLLKPRSVAVVGANDKGNVGARALKNVISSGFGGPIYPVNPNYETLEKRKCYPSLAALPEVPDSVIISVPGGAALPVVRDAEAIGTPSIVLFCDGFVDLGTEEGFRRNAELMEIVNRTGMAVQGPNCMGTRSLRHGYSSSFGMPVSTAGGVFGSGGPRAFQVAAQLSF